MGWIRGHGTLAFAALAWTLALVVAAIAVTRGSWGRATQQLTSDAGTKGSPVAAPG